MKKDGKNEEMRRQKERREEVRKAAHHPWGSCRESGAPRPWRVCVPVTTGLLRFAQPAPHPMSCCHIRHHTTHMGLQTEPLLLLGRCLPFSREAIP